MATRVKMYALGMERELLTADITYQRQTYRYGKPSTELMGGYVTVTFISGHYDEDLLEYIITDRMRDKTIEYPKTLYKFVDLCVDMDAPELYEWFFGDGVSSCYSTKFYSQNGMLITRTSSASVQKIKSLLFVKRWNENWVPSSKRKPYKALKEPQLLVTWVTGLKELLLIRA